MSEFILAINSNGNFYIYKNGTVPLIKDPIVGKRDPDQQYEWKTGSFYYNPYYERRSVFIYRGDEKLVSVQNVIQASRSSFKDPYARTWFEVIPQPVSLGSNSALINMIEAIPRQVKVISQAVMQNLGVRVPADFSPTSAQEWAQWLATVQVPLGPLFKDALRNAANAKPIISREVEVEFLTGKVPAPVKTVHIRMYQIREVTKRVRQIHDTNYVVVNVPVDVLALGPAAVREWIQKDARYSSRFVLEKEPISEQVLKEEITRESPVSIVGYTRDEQYQWHNLWGNQFTQTANDMIREIMEEKIDIY